MPNDRQHHNVTLAVLVTAGTAYSLMQSLVIPALPDIRDSLGASEGALSWMLTAFLLSASVATPILGRLGDMYGKKRLLMITLCVVAVGTLLGALSSSTEMMIAGRVVQGVGGGIFPLAFAIIRDEFPPRRVSHGIGLMSSLLGVGGGLGVVLAGPIVDNLSYHWLFWLPLVATLVALVATHVLVPESPIRAPGRVNLTAAALLSLGLVIVLLVITWATDWGWGSPRTLGGLASGLAVLVGWVAVEMRSREPLVDMRMMRIRGVWSTNLVAFFVGAGMYSAFILLPRFVQEPESTGYGFGASVLAAGVFLLPATFMQVLLGQFAGAIERRVGSKLPLLVGGTVGAAAFLLLVVAHSSPWEVYVASALLGIGIGLTFAALPNLIVEYVRQDQTGVATGMNTVMRTIGGAVGVQLSATLLLTDVGAGGSPASSGYGLAFGMSALAFVASVAVAPLIPRRRSRESCVDGARIGVSRVTT